MRKLILAAVAAASALAAVPASAQVVFSDDFNNASYRGASVLLNDDSDRWASTNYYQANPANSWSFNAGAMLAVNNANPGDGALLLNEVPVGAAASHDLTGLIVGQQYQLSLLLSGDNISGQTYGFDAAVGGNSLIHLTGVVGAAGSNAGSTVAAIFVATASTMTLSLSQFSASAASPIIDNLSVTAVPEPASWGLMIGGFGFAGAAVRRRRMSLRFA